MIDLTGPELLESAVKDDPKVLQPTGRIAESTLKEIYGVDVSGWTAMEVANAITAMVFVLKAKVQRTVGIGRND